MSVINRSTLKIGSPSSKYLVYTSAGHRSNIKKWVLGEKEFDLWVTNYEGGDSYQYEIADYYNERRGGKYPNLYDVYQKWGGVLSQYKAIFVLDDDIEINASQISQLFRIKERYDLVLLQPSFLTMGKISHLVTISRFFRFARYTNFVENCVPLFSKPILDRFMQVYDPALISFGTDWWYLHILTNEERQKIAVIDSIPCINPDERLEKRERKINQLASVEDRIKIWNEVKIEHGIERPAGGVRTLGLIWPKVWEDWVALITAPLISIKVFFFYPHYLMRAKRSYWRLYWRMKGSKNAW